MFWYEYKLSVLDDSVFESANECRHDTGFEVMEYAIYILKLIFYDFIYNEKLLLIAYRICHRNNWYTTSRY